MKPRHPLSKLHLPALRKIVDGKYARAYTSKLENGTFRIKLFCYSCSDAQLQDAVKYGRLHNARVELQSRGERYYYHNSIIFYFKVA
jgi:hypothetical protein